MLDGGSQFSDIRTVQEASEDEPVDSGLFEPLLHDILFPTTQAVGAGRGLELWRKLHDLVRDSSDLINGENVKLYTYPSRCGSMDDFVVKLDLYEGLLAQLEGFGEYFAERQHWMALNELVLQALVAGDADEVELDSFAARRVSYHRTLA